MHLTTLLWKKDFQPKTVFEQRVNDFIVRLRLQKKRRGGATGTV